MTRRASATSAAPDRDHDLDAVPVAQARFGEAAARNDLAVALDGETLARELEAVDELGKREGRGEFARRAVQLDLDGHMRILRHICLNKCAYARLTASSVPFLSFTKTRPPRSRREEATSARFTTVLRWICANDSGSSSRARSASARRMSDSPSRVTTQVYLSAARK